ARLCFCRLQARRRQQRRKGTEVGDEEGTRVRGVSEQPVYVQGAYPQRACHCCAVFVANMPPRPHHPLTRPRGKIGRTLHLNHPGETRCWRNPEKFSCTSPPAPASILSMSQRASGHNTAMPSRPIGRRFAVPSIPRLDTWISRSARLLAIVRN